jgi:SRSO17 transposase
MPRLSTCMEPLVNICPGQGDGPHAPPYVYGLLSAVERHNIASIAERLGQSRLPLQGFMGWPEGDDEPWRQEVRRQGQTPWGPGDGVRGCDPSGFPTSGRESVGGARQWGGRLGTVDPCQGAMYWGYVSRQGPPLVDTRLSLPTAWTKAQARLAKAGVPKGARGYRRRHQLAWERVAQNGAGLPHSWSAGDAERGRPSWCRRHLAAVGERYGLAVPSPTPRRALEVEPPE